ncbi:hypothetical protein [Microcoleus sp. N3A4]|uniref:hypothetical protein n=1 Tax=Microcoleus sp. N3A4 TaxID=3055379 RepID=UPI002FCF12D7
MVSLRHQAVGKVAAEAMPADYILEFFMSVRNRSHAIVLLINKILPLKILKLLASNILRTLRNGAIAESTTLKR